MGELSTASHKDQKTFTKVKFKVKNNAQEISWVYNLPSKLDPKQFFPTKVELHSQQAFGKNNSLKSYTGLPVLTQIAVIVWKSGYLGSVKDKPTNLANALPCGKTTLAMLSNLRNACLLHYVMDLSAVQRYCGGRWKGEHRRTDQMLGSCLIYHQTSYSVN